MSDTRSLPTAVILTALPCECSAVCEHLINRHESTDTSGTVFEEGVFRPERGQAWHIGVVEAGAGNVAAAIEAQKAINHFRPDIAVFVGIAGGLKDVAPGDVVAATKVYGYESGKAENEFRARGALYVSSHKLVHRARAENRSGLWRARIRGEWSGHQPNAFVGPIAAGEKVIASTESEVYQFLRQHYGDALAVEMEGYGFLSAAHANSNVSALVVRGISDLVHDKNKADSFQQEAARAASAFCFEILAHLDQKVADQIKPSEEPKPADSKRDSNIDDLIRDVREGEWDVAALRAVEVLKTTDRLGNNALFEALLEYQYHWDDDPARFWGATQVIECCVRFAPWIIRRQQLARMASHEKFSVRASAASICMDLAHSAPGLVPFDLALRLSVFDEDWYVERPANAALKAMARYCPDVQAVFYSRLGSTVAEERAHAALQLRELAEHEPAILDQERLRKELSLATKRNDVEVVLHLKHAVARLDGVKQESFYRYGL